MSHSSNFGRPKHIPEPDGITPLQAYTKALTILKNIVNRLETETDPGMQASIIHEAAANGYVLNEMRDVIIREMCRKEWSPRTFDAKYGVNKSVVSRALYRERIEYE